MGSLWEPYGKGVPFLGAPGNSLEVGCYKHGGKKYGWVVHPRKLCRMSTLKRGKKRVGFQSYYFLGDIRVWFRGVGKYWQHFLESLHLVARK